MGKPQALHVSEVNLTCVEKELYEVFLIELSNTVIDPIKRNETKTVMSTSS